MRAGWLAMALAVGCVELLPGSDRADARSADAAITDVRGEEAAVAMDAPVAMDVVAEALPSLDADVVAPSDAPRDLPTDEAATDVYQCGQAGQSCCPPARTCAAMLVCAPPGTCQRCGAVGQPCCGGDTCPGGGVCSKGTCQPCGGMRQVCCGGMPPCMMGRCMMGRCM